MAKRLTFDFRRIRGGQRSFPLPERAAGLMLFMFTLGIIAGGVAGTFFLPPADPSSVNAPPSSLPLSFWGSAKYFLALLLAATSYLGVLLAPAMALLRGWALGSAVAALYAAPGWTGFRYAFFAEGVPALLLAPCFIIAACDALEASRWLLERRFGLGSGFPPGRRRTGSRAIVIALLIAAAALYSFYLLPLLLAEA